MIAAVLLAAAAGVFNPVDFFRGRTHGEGVLKVIFKSPQTIKVDSVGRSEADETLVLEQVINEPGKPARTRFWRMREIGPGRYTGTLTDAAGPVQIDLKGDRVHIRYKGKDHLDFDQWLAPAGPRAVSNRMKVKRFGIIVAHFNEVIRKLD